MKNDLWSKVTAGVIPAGKEPVEIYWRIEIDVPLKEIEAPAGKSFFSEKYESEEDARKLYEHLKKKRVKARAIKYIVWR